MGSSKPSFADTLDHLAGREDPAVAAHLAADPDAGEAAARFLRASRAAGRAPRLTRSLARRARRIFRAELEPARPTLLQLLYDSLRTPAPALRESPRAAAPRFLRFGDDKVAVEIQIARVGRSWEMRGQVTPAGFSTAIVLEAAGRSRAAAVDPGGMFRFASLPRGTVSLVLGDARIEDIEI
jgi:hypothetical protein